MSEQRIVRSLGVDRTYTLGNYKNIKLSDYISNIPEGLFLDEDFVRNLRLAQLLKLDEVYYIYRQISPVVQGITDPEEALEIIDEISSGVFEELRETIAQVRGSEEESS